MDTIRVGSFNIKDNSINRNGGLRPDGINNADLISDMIKEKEFDLLGTQELTIKYVNALALRLSNYKFYGNYRYGNLLTSMPFNENNQIITNRSVLDSKTIKLPWVADNLRDLTASIVKLSIMPRIATIVIAENEGHRKICMINTHLDFKIPSIQIRQLDAIKKLVQKYDQDYDVILTGDFNMQVSDKRFASFINDVKDQIKHVDIASSTWHGKHGEEATLDHIFIPKDYKIENAGTIDSNGISDHDAIFADIKKR